MSDSNVNVLKFFHDNSVKQTLPAGNSGIIRCVFIYTHSGSHSASAEPPPSPDTPNSASSDANSDGTSGLKSVAGNNCVLVFYFLLSLTALLISDWPRLPASLRRKRQRGAGGENLLHPV